MDLLGWSAERRRCTRSMSRILGCSGCSADGVAASCCSNGSSTPSSTGGGVAGGLGSGRTIRTEGASGVPACGPAFLRMISAGSSSLRCRDGFASVPRGFSTAPPALLSTLMKSLSSRSLTGAAIVASSVRMSSPASSSPAAETLCLANRSFMVDTSSHRRTPSVPTLISNPMTEAKARAASRTTADPAVPMNCEMTPAMNCPMAPAHSLSIVNIHGTSCSVPTKADSNVAVPIVAIERRVRRGPSR